MVRGHVRTLRLVIFKMEIKRSGLIRAMHHRSEERMFGEKNGKALYNEAARLKRVMGCFNTETRFYHSTTFLKKHL